MVDTFPSLAEILAFAVPLLLAITLHEAAHGLVAGFLGDRTAHEQGRVTLNPIRHIDWIGTVIVPAVLLLVRAPVPIGWARPVPIDEARLRRPRRDMILIALAGPAANLALALLSGFALAWSDPAPGQATLADKALSFSVFANMVIAAFNLLPVMPLDGGRVIFGLLPDVAARRYARLSPVVALILVLILVPVAIYAQYSGIDVVGGFLRPVTDALVGAVEAATGARMVWVWM